MRATLRERDWAALAAGVDGDVLRASSDGYARHAPPAIARFRDVRPQAVVRCASPGDVAAALAFARGGGLPVAVRSGGHCFAGRSSTTGVVIDVGPLDAVTIGDGTVTIGAGAQLAAVYDALDARGLTIPAGCGPTVGIAGLALGGGLGILGRTHGLTCDALLGAEVVLPDGRVVECDEERHDDLFWALRGAGCGAFGVVTSLRFRTLPAPRAMAFRTTWAVAGAEALVDAWQRWAPEGPDELAASLLLSVPADPARPPTATVFGALQGTPAELEALLAALGEQAGAEPEATTRLDGSFRDVKRWLASDDGAATPADDGAAWSRSQYVREPLPASAIAALVGHLVAARVPGQARELDLSPWGGAYNRVPADATAFVHRSARFLVKHGVVVDEGAPGGEAGARAWLGRSWELVQEHGTGGAYPNFPDPDLERPAEAYFGANAPRVLAVRRRYDPDGVLRPGW